MERDCSKALQVLRHLGCSSQDAEEIVQEAFLRLYRYRGDVKSTQAFVVHISKNLFIDLARKRRGREIPFNERFLPTLAPSPESQLNVAQTVTRRLLTASHEVRTADPRHLHCAQGGMEAQRDRGALQGFS
jgi:DNA-directed RNA polymerase specialized sigma24 family protein